MEDAHQDDAEIHSEVVQSEQRRLGERQHNDSNELGQADSYEDR